MSIAELVEFAVSRWGLLLLIAAPAACLLVSAAVAPKAGKAVVLTCLFFWTAAAVVVATFWFQIARSAGKLFPFLIGGIPAVLAIGCLGSLLISLARAKELGPVQVFLLKRFWVGLPAIAWAFAVAAASAEQ